MNCRQSTVNPSDQIYRYQVVEARPLVLDPAPQTRPQFSNLTYLFSAVRRIWNTLARRWTVRIGGETQKHPQPPFFQTWGPLGKATSCWLEFMMKTKSGPLRAEEKDR